MDGGLGKEKKQENSRSEEKALGLSSTSLFPKGNGRQSPMVETTGIDPSMQRITQGAGIVKGWEEK